MRPEDLQAFLRSAPFRPFRLTLTDGRSYDVVHPEFAMLGRTVVVVGLPGSETSESGNGHAGPFFDRHVTISLVHVMQVELLESKRGS